MTIKLGKKTAIVLSVLGILAIIYNVIFFVVPWNSGKSVAATWITYGCTWLALVFTGVVTAIAFNRKEMKSRIFGIPVHCVGYTVLLIQLLIDGIVMGVGHWYEIAFWIPTIVVSALLGPLAMLFPYDKLASSNGLSVGAGMGTCGLVGPLNFFDAFNYNWLVIVIVLSVIVGAGILVFLVDLLFRKLGWFKKGDFSLSNNL